MMYSVCIADWEPTKVRQMNGQSVAAELPAQWQIVTETWNRVVAVPYIAYLPEKDRICMLVSCDYPHQSMVLFSDDHGTTWDEPQPVPSDPAVNASSGLGTALTYLGRGRLMLVAGGWWFSEDYGNTWATLSPAWGSAGWAAATFATALARTSSRCVMSTSGQWPETLGLMTGRGVEPDIARAVDVAWPHGDHLP